MNSASRRSSPGDALADLARSLRLYLPGTGAKAFALWAVVALPGFIFLLGAKAGAGESQVALTVIGLGFLYLAIAIAPIFLVRHSGPILAFFETQPLRSSTKALVLAPVYAAAAGILLLAAAHNAWAPPKTVAFFACCCWAAAAGLIVFPRGVMRTFGWLGLLAMGPLLLAAGHNGGWTGAALVTSALALVGSIAAPRRLAWLAPRGTRLAAPSSPAVPVVAAAPSTRVVDRSAPPRLGATAPSVARVRRASRVSWLDVCGLVLAGRHRSANFAMFYQMAFGGLAFGLALALGARFDIMCGAVMLTSFGAAGALATALSGPVIEFLATRPLDRMRLAFGTIVPCFAVALAFPVAILVWFPPGTVRFGSHRVTVLSMGLRLVFGAMATLFSFGEDARRDRGRWSRVLRILGSVGVFVIVIPLFMPFPGLRALLPPVWTYAAFAAVSAWLWYRRLPPYLLSSAR